MSRPRAGEAGRPDPAAADLAEERDQYLTFGLGGEVFAASVQSVREVLDLQPVSRLANAPSTLLGVIEVRGAGVPVVDLRHKLGLPYGETTEHSRIVVLELEHGGRPLVLGALTDAVYEVVQLEAGGIEPAPEFGQRWDSGFMRGIARRNDRFVTVLELGRVFGADELDLGRPGA